MSRNPKPWLRSGRGWYVQLAGKQISLGRNKTEAFRLYRQLLREPRQQQVSSESFFAVGDEFLQWTLQHRAERTYQWYQERLQSFGDFLKQCLPNARLEEVKPLHVMQWIAKHPKWGSTSQRQAKGRFWSSILKLGTIAVKVINRFGDEVI